MTGRTTPTRWTSRLIMGDWSFLFWLIVVAVGYYVTMRWVLPGLGVPT